jgi:hypothetical protein
VVTDEDAVRSIIELNSEILGSNIADPTTSDMSGSYKAAVDTIQAWWRSTDWSQTKRSIEIDVYPADSLHQYDYANVNITDTLYGFLRIIRYEDDLDTWSRIAKPLKSVTKRTVYFERLGTVNSSDRGWWLIAASGLLMESDPCSRGIDSVHIVSSKALYDTTVTQDYITEYRLSGTIPTFDVHDSITITVYTTDATDSVYLHVFSPYFPWLSHVRSSFVNNANGSFTASWVTPDYPLSAFYSHAAIDVIKHSTLDGDDAYDSKVWGVIYRVESQSGGLASSL